MFGNSQRCFDWVGAMSQAYMASPLTHNLVAKSLEGTDGFLAGNNWELATTQR